MVQVERGEIDGVLVFRPTHFEDHRGHYVETWNDADYRAAGCEVTFVQDDISRSRQHVLRGLHGDTNTWKLIDCLLGTIYFVVLDVRPGSPTEGRWSAYSLSDRNAMQVLVPAGCANGHLVMSEQAIFHYKQSAYYTQGTQFTVRWNDPRYKIWWPISQPILSRRDDGSLA